MEFPVILPDPGSIAVGIGLHPMVEPALGELASGQWLIREPMLTRQHLKNKWSSAPAA